MMKAGSLVMSLLVLSAMPTLADDSAIKVVGGAVQMLDEHSDVRMVSAVITADVYADKSDVRCEYVFTNEGKGQMVTLGFPDMPGREPGDIIPDAHLENFRSWADGQRLSVRLYTSPRKKGRAFDRWYVREIWFSPGQTRKVVNTYTQPNGEISDGSRWFPYSIWLAGSWKGAIGKLDVTVRWREPYLWSLCNNAGMKLPDLAGPPEISDDCRSLSWSPANLEPSRKHAGNIHVYFRPGWRRAIVHGEDDWGSGYGRVFLVFSDLTMAPLRRMARMLGLECVWADGVVVLSNAAGSTFVCRLDSAKAVANGKPITLRRAPMLWTAPGFSKERIHVYAPIRPICEAFGWQCSLDYERCAVVLEGGG